jgi:hypothetical protein
VTVDDLSSVFDHQRPPRPAKYTSYLFRHTSHHITPHHLRQKCVLAVVAKSTTSSLLPPESTCSLDPNTTGISKSTAPTLRNRSAAREGRTLPLPRMWKPRPGDLPMGNKGKRKLTSCEVPQHDPSPNRVVKHLETLSPVPYNDCNLSKRHFSEFCIVSFPRTPD